ncbi:MAG TPA: adenylate/guanylate cyclase domain-containing protein [Candidatus Limnocylindrales bacterium]|nr:adenylate/guanylate cyclase domain-containing protein [Candidatus Limnocylindrales bacterium]
MARRVGIEPGDGGEVNAALAQRLELDELAYEAKTTAERIERLVDIGAIVPGPDGSFQRADVLRSRVVAAFEAEGFSIDQLAIAIREHALVLDSVHLFYPDPSPRTGRSYRELVEQLGPRGGLVGSVLSAMGLSAPSPDGQTRVAEETQLRALIEGWSSVDEQYTVRAARIFGEAARRAAEGWVALFAEAIARPLEARYEAVDEVVPRLVAPAMSLSRLGPRLMSWLLERHLERAMNDLNIARIEARLERRGLLPTRPAHPPAVAFVDVSDYTRLTAQGGDELGALTAVRLGELAETIVRRHGGRVVKLLGDGVLLVFEDPCTAVTTVAELMASMPEADLPPAHGSVHAGPLVERDGDVYGTTVNVASRIAAHAAAGMLLLSDPVVRECPDIAPLVERLGDVTLKGLDEPISLCRWLGPQLDPVAGR